MSKIRAKLDQDLLHSKMQNLNRAQLHLQNLICVNDNLNKEITECLQSKSRDEEIELVSVEKFFKNAPQSLTKVF